MRAAISAEGVVAGYHESDVLRGLDLELREGELLGVLGPNGCGKSTLIRALTRVISLRGGLVRIRGRDLSDYSRRELARAVGVVPQAAGTVFAFTVLETVMMGRTPYIGRFQRESDADRARAEDALRSTDSLHLIDRLTTDLSGGELQRVHIARALAQDPEILLLDEPTSHLDINHQIEVFELMARLRDRRGLTVLCVSHDLNFAAEYCDRIALMRDGRVVRAAIPDEAITAEVLHDIYNTDLPVVENAFSGRPHVVIRRPGKRGSVHA